MLNPSFYTNGIGPAFGAIQSLLIQKSPVLFTFLNFLLHTFNNLNIRTLVDAIQHVHDGVSEFNLIVRQINNVLLANPNFMVRFVKRKANLVAHALARAAIS
jgi:hypothetical protein